VYILSIDRIYISGREPYILGGIGLHVYGCRSIENNTNTEKQFYKPTGRKIGKVRVKIMETATF